MALTEEDKKRIQEEEKFRAEARSKAEKVKKNSGCGGPILLLFLVFIILIAYAKMSDTSGPDIGHKFEEIAKNIEPFKLEIQDKFVWIKDGNYFYVRGRVKNICNKSIKYWKLTAKYLDKGGAVLNQDIDNSNDLVLPGDSDEFEIMTKYNKAYKSVSVEVTETR